MPSKPIVIFEVVAGRVVGLMMANSLARAAGHLEAFMLEHEGSVFEIYDALGTPLAAEPADETEVVIEEAPDVAVGSHAAQFEQRLREVLHAEHDARAEDSRATLAELVQACGQLKFVSWN